MHAAFKGSFRQPHAIALLPTAPQAMQRGVAYACAGLFITLLAVFAATQVAAADLPERLINNHRATMGCWLADIDDDELAEKAIVIKFDVHTLYGFICSSSLSGDSYRLYQVEDGRNEWANLLSFPQLDTKLGWYATTQLQKPTWDEKNKLLRSEVPKQGSQSSCRQFSIYAWQTGRFHIAQIGLAGDCEEKDSEKDLIIYPFVDEVEQGQASGTGSASGSATTPDAQGTKGGDDTSSSGSDDPKSESSKKN